VSKRASEMWKSISAEDRLHWDNEAAKEKQRYLAEKKVYTGPVSRLICMEFNKILHLMDGITSPYAYS